MNRDQAGQVNAVGVPSGVPMVDVTFSKEQDDVALSNEWFRLGSCQGYVGVMYHVLSHTLLHVRCACNTTLYDTGKRMYPGAKADWWIPGNGDAVVSLPAVTTSWALRLLADHAWGDRPSEMFLAAVEFQCALSGGLDAGITDIANWTPQRDPGEESPIFTTS